MIPCDVHVRPSWNPQSVVCYRDADDSKTCATFRTAETLRLFSRRRRKEDEEGAKQGYPEVFEGNPPEVSRRPGPSAAPPSSTAEAKGPTLSQQRLPQPPSAPAEPEAAPADKRKGRGKGSKRPKPEEPLPRPAMERLWQLEQRFLEKRGVVLQLPIRDISPIAAARATLKEPPCPLTVKDLNMPKKGRYPSTRRPPRVVDKSKTSRPKPPQKERDKMNMRCGPETLCTYLAKNSVYRPLANALLRLYIERPEKPAALERLRISLGDTRPNMQGFEEMKNQLASLQEELQDLVKENVSLKRQVDHMERARKSRKGRKVAAKPSAEK